MKNYTNHLVPQFTACGFLSYTLTGSTQLTVCKNENWNLRQVRLLQGKRLRCDISSKDQRRCAQTILESSYVQIPVHEMYDFQTEHQTRKAELAFNFLGA